MDTYPGCMSYGRKEGVALRRLGWLWWVKGRRLSEVGYRKGKERKGSLQYMTVIGYGTVQIDSFMIDLCFVVGYGFVCLVV